MQEFDVPQFQEPIFIKNVFIKPLYNQEFSEELNCIKDWFCKYYSNNILCNNIRQIVSELTYINDRLLLDNSIEFEYTNPIFLEVNPNAKINELSLCTNNKPFMSKYNDFVISALYRCLDNQDIKNDDSALKNEFLCRFLLELFWENSKLIDK